MKKISLLYIITLLLSSLLLFSGCEAEEPLKIEELDSLPFTQTEETSAIAVQETTTEKATVATETTESTTETTESTTETTKTETTIPSTENIISDDEKATSQSQDSAEPEGRTVYITPSGKRYHYSSTCGGKNSYSVSINNVGGRTPCQKCAQ